MIIRHFQNPIIQSAVFEVGNLYEPLIARNAENPRDLWTHLGGGLWIGCWHPNGTTTIPRHPKQIGEYEVVGAFYPPKVETLEAVFIEGKPFDRRTSGTPNIRLLKTSSWPTRGKGTFILSIYKAFLPKENQQPRHIDVIGTRGGAPVNGVDKPLMGMVMGARDAKQHEYEFTPVEGVSPPNQIGVCRLESGESGGPSFIHDGSFPVLMGIHRGPGGEDTEPWIAGVDTWLGHPGVNQWLRSYVDLIEEEHTQEQTKPSPRVIEVRAGEEIIIKGVG